MLAAERRNEILEKLQADKRVVVSELSQQYNVSEETIRRDLDKLDREGLAIKSYGGAIFNEDTNIDLPFNVRKKRNVAGKQKIADMIQTLVGNGDSIILDASTTAVFIAKALKDKENLTVITNSIEIIVELSAMQNWNVISTGGVVKQGYLALIGPKVAEDLSAYNVDKAFLSCKGFDVERGVTDGNEHFAEVKQAMIKSAQERILVVDYSKFDKSAFARICGIDEFSKVVTDQKPSEKWLNYLKEQNIDCIYPEEDNLN